MTYTMFNMFEKPTVSVQKSKQTGNRLMLEFSSAMKEPIQTHFEIQNEKQAQPVKQPKLYKERNTNKILF